MSGVPPVLHRPDLGRFEIAVDGARCVLEYRQLGDQFIVVHTGVPEALRGRGLAEQMTRVALDHARTMGWRVVAQCSYTQRFLQRHPQGARPD